MTVTAETSRCGFSSPDVASLAMQKSGGEKVGPWRTMVVCLRKGREGVKNQNVEDISSQQIDTGPLIPSFFLPSSWTWSALQMAALSHWSFLESEKTGEGGWRDRWVPTTHRLSRLHNLTPLPPRKKPSAALLLPESQPLSQDPTTAASACLPGLLLTTEESTTGSLFSREEAWTTLPLLGVLSLLTSPIRSKRGLLTQRRES